MPSISGTEHALTAMIRLLPIAAVLFDDQLRYLAWSQAFADSYGLGDDLEGRSHLELFPDLPHRWTDLLASCLRGETHSSDRDVYERADGTVEILRWRLQPWLRPDGTAGGALLVTERITDEERLREQLAERDTYIHLLFDHSPIGLNLCRMDGLWVESNQAFLDIIGYTAAEADGGLTYWALTPSEYDEAERVQLHALSTTGRYGPYDKEFIRKDGTRVPVRLNGFIVERNGEEYIWSLIEDMTERRALQAQLEQERLKTIQAAKLATLGEMAAGFAHEINNPLAIIDGWAGLLPTLVEQGETDSIHTATEAISAATQRAARIVRGLRKLSRKSQGEDLEPVPVAVVMEDALSLCQARIRHHGVQLDVQPAVDAQVRCNVIELSQVLINLFNNAFDAVRETPGSWIRISNEVREGVVRIAVADSGPGVPEHARDKIFQPFFTTKAVGKGTGLGLSISRGIAERLGGRLELADGDGVSRFVLALPVEASS